MPSLPRVSRWIVLVVLAALLGAVSGTMALRNGDGSPEAPPTREPALALPEPAELLGDPPQSVIGLEGTSLVHIDLATGEEEVLGEIPNPDAAVDPARRLAYFTDTRTEDDPEPMLRRAPLVDLDSGATLGPGTQPLLSPDGGYVAAMESPLGPRAVLYEADAAPDAEPAYLLPEGRWQLLGWTSEDTLVARAANGDLFTAGPDDETGTKVTGVSGPDVVLVSPTAPLVLARTGQGFAIRSLRGDDQPIPVDLGPRADITGGSWSPEGLWIAGGLSRRSYPEIALIDARTGEWRPMNEARAAGPDVVWSTGRRHLASQIERGDEGFDLVICAVNRDCERPVQTEHRLRILALI